MTNLPTAAEVLAESIMLARGLTSGPHDLDRARLLLDIARELRQGSVRLPVAETSAGSPPELDLKIDRHVGETAAARVERLTWPARYNLDDETLAIDGFYVSAETTPMQTLKANAIKWADEAYVGATATCRHCGEHIVYARPSTDHPAPMWYHNLTIQAVCPHAQGRNIASADVRDAHTFAEPEPSTVKTPVEPFDGQQ